MSSKAVEQGSTADIFKLLIALSLLVAGAVAFYIYSEYSLLMRVLALLGVAGVAVFIAMQTNQGRFAWAFVGGARTEVRKVIWPTRQETMQTTLIVIVMVVLVGIMLWIMDSFLLWAVRLLTGQGD
ncbi:MAG TPA: preprotein translocase subunit SecE [Gammaproteobacteria bacterium]|nr:preprotein translocase subunit SecE [Gammaproteobacteria bacterium]